jgi:hypothetical protein
MKVLKIVLIACSLSAAAAHAQTATTEQAPPAQEQQVAQADTSRPSHVVTQKRFVAPKTEECVGPVSFCNIFFGS